MSEIKILLKNFSSSAIGTLLGQIINFFTLLYLPRVLGPDGYGIFSFSQSLAMYFLLFADLGLSLYCIRNVNQKEESEVENEITSIFSMKIILSIISTIGFILIAMLFNGSNLERKSLFFMSFSILGTGIFIDYIFNSLNNMKYIGISVAIKNTIFFILCISFIKDIKQTYLVALFYSLGIIISSLFLIFIFKKTNFKLKFRKVKLKEFNIIKASIPLAISLFMVQINNNFDIIYLSATKNQDIVGYYSAPYKIINFLIAILCIYFNAAYPTIAKLIKNNKEDLNKYIYKFYYIGVVFIFPIVFGGIVLNKDIIMLLFGSKFAESEMIFVLLLPLILIRMITSTFGSVLIMGEGSKLFSRAVFMGASINILLNIILVPRYEAEGAALATLICEISQGILLYIYFRKYCDTKIFKCNIIPLISSSIMVIFLINLKLNNLFLKIFLGAIVYLISIVIIYFIINPKMLKKLNINK
ncbi:flippase [Clostridium perfringens]|nr:flippase [Clostridium perfringens]